jgi:hypothetical protein
MDVTNVAGAVVSQALMNIRTVASFGLEKKMLHIFDRNLEIPLVQFHRKGLVTGTGMGFSRFVVAGGSGLAWFSGGQLVLVGNTDFNSVFLVIIIIILGSVGLGKFASESADKVEAGLAAAKIRKILLLNSNINGMDDNQGTAYPYPLYPNPYHLTPSSVTLYPLNLIPTPYPLTPITQPLHP